MILVLRSGSSDAEVAEVLLALQRRGIEGRVMPSSDGPLVHLVSGPTRGARKLLKLEQVEALVPTSGPRVRAQGRRFYPYHFVQLAAAAVVTIGVLVLLAGHRPPGIGAPIDAQHPPAELSWSWYLRAPLSFVALFPEGQAWLGWVCLYAIAALLFLLPFYDRARPSGRGISWPVAAFGIALAAGWLGLMLAGSVR